MNIICRLKGHKWKFAYNYGIPLGNTEDLDTVLEKFKTGEYFAVNRCERCGMYDHASDGLNPYVKEGFSE